MSGETLLFCFQGRGVDIWKDGERWTAYARLPVPVGAYGETLEEVVKRVQDHLEAHFELMRRMMKHETGGEILFSMKSESPQQDGVDIEVTFYEERGEPRVEAAVTYRSDEGDSREGIFRMSPGDARKLYRALGDALDKFDAGEFNF